MGESIHGSRFEIGNGGKAANQAVMAARLGSEVTLVAKLGTDVFGEGMLAGLRAEGVDTTHVSLTDEAHSGVAPIAVDEHGENAIIVVTGANDLLGEVELEEARDAIAGADVLVCELEIRVEATLAALRLAREAGVRTILNPAPARALPDEAYTLSDVFCPNEPEAEDLAGTGDVERAARSFRERGAGAVIVTLGERGCLVVEDEVTAIEAPRVNALDTTGAGDAFVGTLAHELARGQELLDAARLATRVASMSVERRGTQTSFPTAEELAGLE